MGWTEKPEAAAIFRELRSNTTMPLACIAQRLKMGSRGHLAWLLQQKPAKLDASSEQALLKL